MMRPLILKVATIEDISDYRSRLFGKNISKMTKEDMLDLYKQMYNDNYFNNIDDKSKIQIRDYLVKRLDRTILEKQIEAETGINREWIENLLVEVLEGVEELMDVPADEYEYAIRFWQGIGLSDVVMYWQDYCIDSDNREKFDAKMKNMFDKKRLVTWEYMMISQRLKLKNTNFYGELIKKEGEI